MTDTTHNVDTVPGVQVDIDRLESAAKTLATADAKNWGNPDVRNRYRGLALSTIGAYLAAPGEE